jgi:hypothetical protein
VPLRRNIPRVKESTRLHYLDAMGIDSWVSRVALPGAASSRRKRVMRRPASVSAVTAPASDTPAAGPALLRSSIQKNVTVPRAAAKPAEIPVAEPAAEASSSDSPAVIFSVSVAFMGGWYWIDEVPRGRETGADYSQLLQAIGSALGWSPAAVTVERFDWPLQGASRLDPGLETARHSFEGFMRGRLERQPVQGVVLLGSAACEWLNLDMFVGLSQVHTVSAWLMLRQRASKAQAWQDLRSLRHSP